MTYIAYHNTPPPPPPPDNSTSLQYAYKTLTLRHLWRSDSPQHASLEAF